jgi:hypothetical protein
MTDEPNRDDDYEERVQQPEPEEDANEHPAIALFRSNAVISSRAGWRLFKCDECGVEWQTTSRDIYSPSGEDCVCCGAWVHPFSLRQDPQVATDALGNVIDHEGIVVCHGRKPSC